MLLIGFLIPFICSICIVYFKNDDSLESDYISRKKMVMDRTLSMMLEKETGSGEYEMVTRSDWPTEGYIFNKTLSKCENGSEISRDVTNKLVLFDGNSKDKCYAYFDKVQMVVINSVSTSDITTTSLTLTINATKGTFDISKYYYSIDNGSSWNSSTSNVISVSGLTEGITYTIKTYVQDVKGTNSEYKSVSVTTSSVNLISFTIDGTEYYAEDGMTWDEWLNSEYNVGDWTNSEGRKGYYIVNAGIGIGTVADSNSNIITDMTTLIIENYSYKLVEP